jgi:hypothetical protein
MDRKPRVDSSPKEKWQVAQEGNKERECLGDVSASRDRSESTLSMKAEAEHRNACFRIHNPIFLRRSQFSVVITKIISTKTKKPQKMKLRHYRGVHTLDSPLIDRLISVQYFHHEV